jgi:hypothetical protein
MTPDIDDPLPALEPEVPRFSDEDEALLRRFGTWLHEEDQLDAEEPAIDLYVPSATLTPEEYESGSVAESTVPAPTCSWLRRLVSHGAVAAIAVLLVNLIPPAEPKVDPPRDVDYELKLLGGDGRTFAPSSASPHYHADSDFGFVLRPSAPVDERSEVVIQACPAGSDCRSQHFVIRLGPEHFESDRGGVLRFAGPMAEVLPLAEGRWTLRLFVSAPGSCSPTDLGSSCHSIAEALVTIEDVADDAP